MGMKVQRTMKEYRILRLRMIKWNKRNKEDTKRGIAHSASDYEITNLIQVTNYVKDLSPLEMTGEGVNSSCSTPFFTSRGLNSYNVEADQAFISSVRIDTRGNPLKPVEDKTLPICWKGSKPCKSFHDVKSFFTPVTHIDVEDEDLFQAYTTGMETLTKEDYWMDNGKVWEGLDEIK